MIMTLRYAQNNGLLKLKRNYYNISSDIPLNELLEHIDTKLREPVGNYKFLAKRHAELEEDYNTVYNLINENKKIELPEYLGQIEML